MSVAGRRLGGQMMETLLAEWGTLIRVAVWAGAALGVLSVIVAVRQPSRRRVALLLAALLFLPIGVLGILSIGVVFLVAAAVCLGFAVFSRPSKAGTHA